MIHADVLALLAANGPFMELLPGGLWDTPLDRPQPGQAVQPWHTPEAFDAAGAIKPSGVMLPVGLVRHPTQSDWGQAQAFPELHLYVPTHSGDGLLVVLAEAARTILTGDAGDGLRYVGQGGRRYRVDWSTDGPGPRQATEYPNTRHHWVRFVVAHKRTEVTT